VVLAAVALAWDPRWWALPARRPLAFVARPWWRVNRGLSEAQAINVWIIQIVAAIGPTLGALIFDIYIKTDWGIPMFFLTPLALIAIPTLRVHKVGAPADHRHLAYLDNCDPNHGAFYRG
jgi:hypothetical protein